MGALGLEAEEQPAQRPVKAGVRIVAGAGGGLLVC